MQLQNFSSAMLGKDTKCMDYHAASLYGMHTVKLLINAIPNPRPGGGLTAHGGKRASSGGKRAMKCLWYCDYDYGWREISIIIMILLLFLCLLTVDMQKFKVNADRYDGLHCSNTYILSLKSSTHPRCILTFPTRFTLNSESIPHTVGAAVPI